MQGVRRYVTLFESPFVDSSLSEKENNTLRVSALLAVPPPPPEVQPLERLQGTNLPKASLTQWASYVQDVALGMWRPPRTATDCPNQGSRHHCKLKSPQWWKAKWIHSFYPAYPSGIRILRRVNSFTHCLETLGTSRTQTWGLSLSYSRVISNYRVGIRDNSPPGCYGHILPF